MDWRAGQDKALRSVVSPELSVGGTPSFVRGRSVDSSGIICWGGAQETQWNRGRDGTRRGAPLSLQNCPSEGQKRRSGRELRTELAEIFLVALGALGL